MVKRSGLREAATATALLVALTGTACTSAETSGDEGAPSSPPSTSASLPQKEFKGECAATAEQLTRLAVYTC